MTSYSANLNGIIQRLSFNNYKHLKNKKSFSVYDDNMSPFFREFHVFSIEHFKIISNFGPLQRMSRMTKYVTKAGKVDLGGGGTGGREPGRTGGGRGTGDGRRKGGKRERNSKWQSKKRT